MAQKTSFDQITLQYNSGPIPPPFCHKYTMEISRNDEADISINLKLEYYDREELTEDEIYDEGFTMDDNYEWSGDLPTIWGNELDKKLQSTNWNKKMTPNPSGSEFLIKLKQKGKSELLQPTEPRTWEVFAQEIIQAVFELGKKEAPLQISFISKDLDRKDQKADFTFSFAQQQILKSPENKDGKSIDWNEGQRLLKYIYTIDYYPEEGFEKIPDKPGNYIAPGDGLWYELIPHENAGKATIERFGKLVETLKNYC